MLRLSAFVDHDPMMDGRAEIDAALRATRSDETIGPDHIDRIDDGWTRSLAWSARRRNGLLDARDVETMLADRSRIVRRRGLEFAVDAPSVDVVTFLGGDDVDLAELAAFVIGERADPPSTADLRALIATATEHSDALCRETAIASLGAIAESHGNAIDPVRLVAVRDAILRGLEDRATVRRRAVIALAAFHDPETDAAIESARTDRDRQVRSIADALR